MGTPNLALGLQVPVFGVRWLDVAVGAGMGTPNLVLGLQVPVFGVQWLDVGCGSRDGDPKSGAGAQLPQFPLWLLMPLSDPSSHISPALSSPSPSCPPSVLLARPPRLVGPVWGGWMSPPPPETELRGGRVSAQILRLKVGRLEQLLHLKNVRIDDLSRRLQQAQSLRR